jgi:hypothetical protein
LAQAQLAAAADLYQHAFDISPNTRAVSTLFRARVANAQVPPALELMEKWLVEQP